MLLACILFQISLIVSIQRLRFSPAELAHASPLHVSMQVWSWLPWVLGVVAAIGLVLGSRLAARRGHLRSWLELLFFQAVLAGLIWGILPSSGFSVFAGIMVFLSAVLMYELLRQDGWRPIDVEWKSKFRRALPPTALATLAMSVAILLGSQFSGRSFDSGAMLLSLFLYPIFAALQLLVFLILPLPRMRRLSDRPRTATIACATVFSLVHWPNPLLMAACFTGMLVWAAIWQRRPSLPALALGMGITASLFAQMLPDTLTEHLRTGPPAVFHRTSYELAGTETGTDRLEGIDSYLRRIYPSTIGRDIAADELEHWRRTVAVSQRLRAAWQFFSSEEYNRKFGSGPSVQTGFVRQMDPQWRARLETFAGEDYLQAHGGHFEGYVKSLYTEVLKRQPAPQELRAWSDSLTTQQRTRLAQILLLKRRDLRKAPFDTMGLDDLSLP